MGTKINSGMKSFYLVVLSAFLLDGAMVRAGDIIEVPGDDAKDLLRRGKARLATADDGVEVLGGPSDDEAERAEEEPKAGKARK